MRYSPGRLTTAFLILCFAAAGCAGDEGMDATDGTIGDTVATGPIDTSATGPAMPSTVQKINLNTASSEDFMEIPNMGERMVHEFEEYRPYVSIQQFRREIGKYVDEGQVAEYEQYVFVPIDPNESDAETLMQVPGLDASEADALIEARPFASDEAFMEALSGYISQSELETAEGYLAES